MNTIQRKITLTRFQWNAIAQKNKATKKITDYSGKVVAYQYYLRVIGSPTNEWERVNVV